LVHALIFSTGTQHVSRSFCWIAFAERRCRIQHLCTSVSTCLPARVDANKRVHMHPCLLPYLLSCVADLELDIDLPAHLNLCTHDWRHRAGAMRRHLEKIVRTYGTECKPATLLCARPHPVVHDFVRFRRRNALFQVVAERYKSASLRFR